MNRSTAQGYACHSEGTKVKAFVVCEGGTSFAKKIYKSMAQRLFDVSKETLYIVTAYPSTDCNDSLMSLFLDTDKAAIQIKSSSVFNSSWTNAASLPIILITLALEGAFFRNYDLLLSLVVFSSVVALIISCAQLFSKPTLDDLEEISRLLNSNTILKKITNVNNYKLSNNLGAFLLLSTLLSGVKKQMCLEKNLVRQLAVRIALDGNRKSTLDIITSSLEGNEYSSIIEPALKDTY